MFVGSAAHAEADCAQLISRDAHRAAAASVGTRSHDETEPSAGVRRRCRATTTEKVSADPGQAIVDAGLHRAPPFPPGHCQSDLSYCGTQGLRLRYIRRTKTRRGKVLSVRPRSRHRPSPSSSQYAAQTGLSACKILCVRGGAIECRERFNGDAMTLTRSGRALRNCCAAR